MSPMAGCTAHHNADVAAMLEVRIEDRAAGRGTGSAGVPWRISYSPVIQKIICHTKSLKSHAERV
jgi:hypothetical protein